MSLIQGWDLIVESCVTCCVEDRLTLCNCPHVCSAQKDPGCYAQHEVGRSTITDGY